MKLHEELEYQNVKDEIRMMNLLMFESMDERKYFSSIIDWFGYHSMIHINMFRLSRDGFDFDHL